MEIEPELRRHLVYVMSSCLPVLRSNACQYQINTGLLVGRKQRSFFSEKGTLNDFHWAIFHSQNFYMQITKKRNDAFTLVNVLCS